MSTLPFLHPLCTRMRYGSSGSRPGSRTLLLCLFEGECGLGSLCSSLLVAHRVKILYRCLSLCYCLLLDALKILACILIPCIDHFENHLSSL